jgi:hypothetical protein
MVIVGSWREKMREEGFVVIRKGHEPRITRSSRET